MKKVVVTCITNDYDTLKEPLVRSEGYQYICFTDRPENYSSDIWEIRPLPENVQFIDRKIKMLTHKYVEYDICVWVDGKFHITGELSHAESLFDKFDLVLRQHAFRDNIFEEMDKTIEMGLVDPMDMNSQKYTYLEQDIAPKGLYELGVYLKKKSIEVEKLMEMWWEEFNLFPFRDQISLPVVINRKFLSDQKQFARAISHEYFRPFINDIYFHKKGQVKRDVKARTLKIWDHCPFAPDKNLGKAINDFCYFIPKNDWILIRDGDTYFPDSFYGNQLIEIIKKYPETDLFGCYTNRLGLDWQVPFPNQFNNDSIAYHNMAAKYLKAEHDTDCKRWYGNLGGLFLLFNKQLWNQIKFSDGLVTTLKTGSVEQEAYIDFLFCKDVQENSGIVRIIKGVYLFHNYRYLDGENAIYSRSHIK